MIMVIIIDNIRRTARFISSLHLVEHINVLEVAKHLFNSVLNMKSVHVKGMSVANFKLRLIV